MIVAAAIKETNGTIHTGKKHCDIILSAIRGGMTDDFKEGFMTSEGAFVNRAEAAEIALNSGQIKKIIGVLHSEDLW